MTAVSLDELILGQEPGAAIAQIRARHSTAFALADEVSHYLNYKLNDSGARRCSLQQGLQAALLLRLISAYQGCVLTSERGMQAEAILLGRKVLEVTFRIVAISKSEDLAAKYLQTDHFNRRRILGKLRSLTSIRRSAEETASLDKLHAEADEKVRGDGIEEVTTKRYAEVAGLLDYYNTAYAHFSQSVHAHISDLEALVVTDEEGDPVAFRYGPVTGFQSQVLATAIESVVMSLEAMFTSRNEDVPAGVSILSRKMQALFVEIEASGAQP